MSRTPPSSFISSQNPLMFHQYPETYRGTPLTAAARVGNIDIVKMLLDSGADINHFTEWRRPALAIAARMGNIALAKLLIERGADVNRGAVHGSALAEVECKDHLAIVQMLLDNGADINFSCRDKAYSTALEKQLRRRVQLAWRTFYSTVAQI